VGVDQAGQQDHVVTELDDLPSIQTRLRRFHGGEAPAGDPDAAGLLAPGRHETASA